MPQKMMSPNTTIVWVPKSGVVDPYNPTAVELNAGVNISCAIVRGYTLNPTASDVDNTASICDEGNVDNRGAGNYEGNITFFRDANIADNVSVFNRAWALFRKAGAAGYLYRRVGYKSSVTFSVAQEVEGFQFESDVPQTIDGTDGGGPIQFTVPFLQQGLMTGQTYVGPLVAATVTTSAPATSPVAGNNTVVVTGTNFYGVLGVTVGGVPVNSFMVLSPTSIQIQTPPNTAGAKTVVVTTPAGSSAAGAAITYA